MDYTFNTAAMSPSSPQLIRFFGYGGYITEMCGNNATPIAATTHVS